ncbi:NAD(P)-binding protein [Byssothecium circinans]|uniref:NAD(P)-binding protein n=1 Tax=Byssothecium circinans TaxID=147558 RepID=A0A6A5TN26_9PLEO|nr:NAD(P)-binding protein [Byssothecium circinans]
MSEIKNVIVVGAGGNLGPSILNILLNESSFTMTVLSREGSNSTFPAAAKVIRADYDSVDSLKSAFQGQDAVLSIVGGTALGDQNKLIDAAIAAGVKRFLPSEYGSNTVDPRLREIVPISSAKMGTVDYLKSKEDVISWSSVVCGAFFDWSIKTGFMGFDSTSKTATLIDDGKGVFSASNLRHIGRALVKVLENAAETRNKYIYVSSFETSQAELLSWVEKVSGQKWTVKNVTSKEMIQLGNEKLKRGDFSGIVELIKASCFGGEGLGDLRLAGLWNEKLGLEKDDLEESVRVALSGKLVGER